MIKMTEFFKSKRSVIMITGVICLIVLCVGLLTNALTRQTPDNSDKVKVANGYDVKQLVQLKTPYVGNNSAVSTILVHLPAPGLSKGFSLKTDQPPYGITVNYDIRTSSASTEEIQATFSKNAAILFALIDNVADITFDLKIVDIKMVETDQKLTYNRTQMQKSYVKDFREYAKDSGQLAVLLNSVSMELLVAPSKYSPFMSSTPGIKIGIENDIAAEQVIYGVPVGNLLTWDNATGKITEYGKDAQLSVKTPIYWSSIDNEKANTPASIPVHVTAIHNNAPVAERQVIIVTQDGLNYEVEDFQGLWKGTEGYPFESALNVVKAYFEAFAKEDYKAMQALSTERHNQEVVHNGDVWGMKWAKAKEIKFDGRMNEKLRFGVSVEMETVKTSSQYPSKQTFFFVELEQGQDGNWKVDGYTTG